MSGIRFQLAGGRGRTITPRNPAPTKLLEESIGILMAFSSCDETDLDCRSTRPSRAEEQIDDRGPVDCFGEVRNDVHGVSGR